MRVAVIGGGPSGLVTLKYLARAHLSLDCDAIEARLFELEDSIGGAFTHRAYEDAELVSSKQLTTFSDFRCCADRDFLSASDYVQYLHDYYSKFRLWPSIELGAEVRNIQGRSPQGYVVEYAKKGGEVLTWRCDAVAVCSGLHREPNLPTIPGLNHVPEVMHSSKFKTKSQFGVNKTVMIVGSGETGADVAYLAVNSPTKQVLMCHKDGFHFAPKVAHSAYVKPNPSEPGIPIDVSRANLFDTTYVHQALRNSMILWEYYNYYIKVLLWVCSARPIPLAIRLEICSSADADSRHAWETGRSRTATKRIDDGGVVEFVDNGRPEYERIKLQTIQPDVIVLCTGYQQTFPFLDDKLKVNTNHLSSHVRGIWRREQPTMGFIGFVRPSLGAIPPLAEMQAQLWVLNLVAPRKLPVLNPGDEIHYKLHSKSADRVTYGVDHESYAYQLALDMNSAPGIVDIWRITRTTQILTMHSMCRLLIIWAFGAHFNTKFRLVGPWVWDGAIEVLVSDEFWHTITRRPLLFGHLLVSILPIAIFAPLSMMFLLYHSLLSYCRPLVQSVAL
ncbi:Dimethylaniline monooxygenase [N-oxide-forming] 2 [Fusarium oxysporum f. sp. raphani]|uniref:Dimethylaniline monooxygenase [N-oxide-forming] 2 n=1 Tax=Fusarium oxysporum f. sp. raphani TaxID=96318 RepID=A0A8J5P194_FUSOX|nr:Dimethylaniline monooxygenase [N-oxide-forming] 2 [Fusarium oxysporum f. sp. raphani]